MEKKSADLLPYFKQYGSNCMAYTSLEPDMEHFVMDGVGYIAYVSYKHWLWAWKERKIVLADPVCAEEDYQKIFTAFIKKKPNVIFVGVSTEPAKVLEKMGYMVNQFGIETDILLNNFDLGGKKRAKLRQWRNKCEREGVVVREKPIADCQNVEEIKELSKKWLQNKRGRRVEFLVRPLRFNNEEGVRHFWAHQNGNLIAFAVFDPIYENGEVIGYFHNMDRYKDDVPHGTSVYIILSAIEIFRQEGVQFVALGMSPLCLQKGMKNELDSYHLRTRKSFWYAFDKLNFLYPFKGNASHKNKFNGLQKPIYISSTNGMGLKEVFIMIKAIGVF